MILQFATYLKGHPWIFLCQSLYDIVKWRFDSFSCACGNVLVLLGGLLLRLLIMRINRRLISLPTHKLFLTSSLLNLPRLRESQKVRRGQL